MTGSLGKGHPLPRHPSQSLKGRPARTWSMAWQLARRELRGGLKGFRIFLACLVLGVAAIAAVGSVSQSMLAGLQEDGQAILGGDMNLRLVHKEATTEQLDWFETRAAVSKISEMRAMALGPESQDETAGEASPVRRVLVELKAVDQLYPLYGAARLAPNIPLDQALAEQDGHWGAVVDKGLLRRLNVAIGDLVRVGEADYRIAATLEWEPDKASRGFTLGPTFMVAAASLAGTGLVQPGSLIRYHYRLALNEPEALDQVRADLVEAFPDAGWRINDTHNAAPRVTRFIDRLTLFLTLVGLGSLLVGGVGIGNAVRAYLDGKVATIATLKCLGAPGILIFKAYLIQILLLAAVGIVIGLGLGATSPYLVAYLLGNAFGWEASGGLYPGALALAALFGVLTAFTFSLWPLARAQAIAPASLFRDIISPNRARPKSWVIFALVACCAALAGLAIGTASNPKMASYFVIGAAGAFLLFRLTAQGLIALARRLGRPRQPALRLAITNLYRPGAPTGSVIMSLGLGLTLLVTIALIEGNLTQQVRQSLPEEAPGFYFIDIQPDQVAAFDQLVGNFDGTRDLTRVPMLRGRISAVEGTPPTQMTIPPEIEWVFRGDRGLTWSREPIPDAELLAGEWWPEDYNGEPLVSLDAQVGELLGLQPGDRLTINILGREFEVTIANLRVIDWSALSINFVMVFSPGLLESAPQSHIASVKTDPDIEDALEAAVTDQFLNVSAIRVKEALGQVAELIGHIAVAVRGIATLAILAGGLVLAGAVAAEHHRRIYDAVVFKVLGATRGRITRAFLLEYGILGLITAAIAGVIGTLAAYLVLTEVMDMPFIFLPAVVVLTALLASFLTILLGYLGTLRALSHKAAPLLRNE